MLVLSFDFKTLRKNLNSKRELFQCLFTDNSGIFCLECDASDSLLNFIQYTLKPWGLYCEISVDFKLQESQSFKL